jgi:tetratricopeptide (TPR) repeat protein
MLNNMYAGGVLVARKSLALWMKLVIFLALVLIIAISIFPSYLKAAASYERGREAQREGRHSTAIKEYEQVLHQFPEAASVMARLAISYFHNERIGDCSVLLDRIAGKEVSGSLSRQVNEIVEKMDSIYYESRELGEALEQYGLEELEKTAGKLDKYLESRENDVMGLFHRANISVDLGKYQEAEKLYLRAIELQPEFYSAYINLAAVYRETGQLEKAEEYCSKVLGMNKEHPQAFVGLSKTAFAGNDAAAGLEYAEKAYSCDSGDMNIISNLSLAYHYNGMAEERDKYFEILRQNNYYDLPAMQQIFAAGAK